jgi:hypothetical protein
VLVSGNGIDVREVRVPLVSGTDARRLIVSRDGTRLIAVVRTPGGDRVVAARVVLGDESRGRVARVVESSVIRTLTGRRAIDVAWTAAAQIAVLSPAGELFEVETVAADGATVGVDTLSTMVTGRVIGLASEPYVDTPVYAVGRGVLIDIRTGERVSAPKVRALDYAG